MQSIGRNIGQKNSAAKDAVTADASAGSLILPKFLRKPTRHVSRLLTGGFYLTQNGLTIFVVVFALILAVAGLIVGGQAETVVTKVDAFNILGIKQYDVSGNSELSNSKVVEILAPKNGETLFGFDVTRARVLLRENPWVSDASVAKVYPDKIAVHIEERLPFALWQQGDVVKLVDREGRALADFTGRYPYLPLVVGDGAASHAASLLSSLERFPEIATRVKARIRVGNRRWDLQLDNGLLVMLPEIGVERELQRLAKLSQEQGIFERELKRIDLRLPDRLVLKLSDAGLAHYQQLVKERQYVLAKATRGRQL